MENDIKTIANRREVILDKDVLRTLKQLQAYEGDYYRRLIRNVVRCLIEDSDMISLEAEDILGLLKGLQMLLEDIVALCAINAPATDGCNEGDDDKEEEDSGSEDNEYEESIAI